jgi:hypothetical protein
MIAYKFLAHGAVSPISRFAWPIPASGTAGEWVEASGALAPCARGVHVCRPMDLAHWLNEELWAVQADGDTISGFDCVVVRRARLLGQIDAWSDGGSMRFAQACIERAETSLDAMAPAASRELIDDAKQAASAGYVSVSAYASALAIARGHGQDDIEASFRQERAWQSQWIAETLLGSELFGSGQA